MKSDISIALVLNVALCLLVNPANGQVSQIAPEWKAYFSNPPVIENCVYEVMPYGQKNKTFLFQFRWQTNAFLFREISSLAEASSNHINQITPVPGAIVDSYIGRYEKDSWCIQPSGDPYGTLYLFPNTDDTWDALSTNAVENVLYMGQGELSSTLYLGIDGLDPATLRWVDITNFTALVFNGIKMVKMVGDITGISNGLPTGLDWRIADMPEGFSVEYKYDNQGFGLPYFPSEISTFTKSFTGDISKNHLVMVTKILLLKTSSTPLPKSFFDPETYFVTPPASRHQPAVILYTNGQTFAIEQGHLATILAARPSGNIGTPAINVTLVRVLFLVFFVLSGIGLLFIWKRTKQK